VARTCGQACGQACQQVAGQPDLPTCWVRRQPSFFKFFIQLHGWKQYVPSHMA
jgi:hypothetical protein